MEIRYSKTIEAPKEIVWEVITNADAYSDWNEFVTSCRSTFRVGEPIKMKVRVLPFFSMSQKETILQCDEGSFIEYGFSRPCKMLISSRHHVVSPINEMTTRYDSVLTLRGWLAPCIRFLLGAQLKRGFGDMTEGIACRSVQVYNERNGN